MTLASYADLKVPEPTITAVSAPFWAGVKAGQLLLQHCAACGQSMFYPRAICPHCWSLALDWRPASGRGQLATWSMQHRPGHPGWQGVAPYAIGLVTLEEGPTLLSQILVPEPDLRLGLALRVRFVQVGPNALPFFEAAS